jgi:chromosome segregation ATPase
MVNDKTNLVAASEQLAREIGERVAQLSRAAGTLRASRERVLQSRAEVVRTVGEAAGRVEQLRQRQRELAESVEAHKGKLVADAEGLEEARLGLEVLEGSPPEVADLIALLERVEEAGRLSLPDAREIIRRLEAEVLPPVNVLIEAGAAVERRVRGTTEHAEKRRAAMARDEAALAAATDALPGARAEAERAAQAGRAKLEDIDGEIARLDREIESNKTELDAAKAERRVGGSAVETSERLRAARRAALA